MSGGLAPGFLIAVPQLLDDNFDHSVVLLLYHDEDGAMGLVINRPLDLPLDEVARQHDIEDCQRQGSVHYGGPVESFRGFVLHRGPGGDDDTEVRDGVFITGSAEVLRTLLGDSEPEFRLFLGYAGWGPGQLDAELTAGAWIAAEFDPAFIFASDPGQVWEGVLATMGIDPATVLQPSGEIA